MKLFVVIPTIGRKDILSRMLVLLAEQARLPDEVIVSAPDATHVEPYASNALKVTLLVGRRGSSAQRNLALDYAIAADADIITFFDDDFLPSPHYLARLVALFEQHADWAVINGNLIKDGVHTGGLDFEEGIATLRAADAKQLGGLRVTEHPGAYGCNMSIRASAIGDNRFDERLVLYGWQEDIDFTQRVGRGGRIVGVSTLLGVHLGARSARVSGVRFGYSQIVNPVYLIGKGTMPLRFAASLMGRNLLANLLKCANPEPWIDRTGRLNGNLLAIWHLVRGRIEPEYILKL